MRVLITKHAYDRAKSRMGLNKSATKRMAKKAFNEGKEHKEVSGSLSRYLDKIFLKEKNINNIRIYGEFIYLFQDRKLITVYNLSNRYKGR